MASSTGAPVLASLCSTSSNPPNLSGATLCPYPARAEATTGESSEDMYAHGEVCRLDEDRAGIGAYCPIGSMVRESYDGIIGDAPAGAIPFHRLFDVGDSLRRHAYAAIVGG